MSGLRVDIRPASPTDFGSMSNEELFRAAGIQPPSGNRAAGGGSGGQPAISSMSNDELFALVGMQPDRVTRTHLGAEQPRPADDPLTAQALRANAPGVPTSGQSFTRGAVQGATLNFGDEIIGAAAASGIPQAVSSALGGGTFGRVVGSATALPAAIVGGARMAGEAFAPNIFGNSITPEYERVAGIVREQNQQDMSVNPLATIAGNVAGGLALPVGGALGQAGTAGQRFATGARLGAAMGAGYGAGDGEDLSSRAGGAAVGGLVGGILGGGINAAIGPRVPVPRPSNAGPPGHEVAAAAGRLDIQLPSAVASDSLTTQRMGAGVRNIPIFGNAIVSASQRASGQMNDAANRIAAEMGAVSRDQAGMTAATAIRDWTTNASKQLVSRAYDAVDNAIPNPSQLNTLNATQGAVADLMTRRTSAAMPSTGSAVDLVAEAVMRPGGLTYDGIKTLRTSIGELIDNVNTPSSISQKELRRIYAALSDDLRAAVVASGSSRALALFERANNAARLVSQRREELARVIGTRSEASAEKVFDELLRLASDRAGGNISRLAQARRTMTADEWQEVSATIVSRMGRDAENNFTPDRFITAWGNLSPQGKALLFGANNSHRQALDDLAAVSSRFKLLNQFGNPSGTAQNMGVQGLTGVGAVGAYMADPTTAIGSVVGTMALAAILSRPATAASMARWSRAYEVAVARPSAGSVAALQSASRNFANTIGERLGLTVDPMDFLRAIQGAQPIRAEGEQNNQQ